MRLNLAIFSRKHIPRVGGATEKALVPILVLLSRDKMFIRTRSSKANRIFTGVSNEYKYEGCL